MLFPSHAFLLVFLPAAVLVYWLVPPQGGWRKGWLLLSSAVFYGSAGVGWLLLLLGMTGATHLAARHLMSSARPAARRLGLALVFANLAALAAFKYYDPVATALNARLLRLALPLGMSFYTFNLLGYGLDVFRRRVEPAATFLDLAAYSTFFPTVASGPLMRWSDFRGQVDAARCTDAGIERGIFNLTLGLAKKLLVADWLAQVADPLWGASASLGLWGAWIALLAYHFRIYFDFSGYSDIAVGLGHLLGVSVPANFKAPYTARSMTEFWQRWHVTLSEWFRDYLFFPLSRGLLRRGGSRHPSLVRALSLVTTMSLIGLWHGPSAGFLVWGAYQGLLLAVNAQLRDGRRTPWRAGWARAATTLAVLIGWVVFRSSSLGGAGEMYAALFGARGWGPAPTSLPGVGLEFLLLLGGLAVLTNLPRDTGELRPRRGWAYAAALAALLTIGLMWIEKPAPFLYFQF